MGLAEANEAKARVKTGVDSSILDGCNSDK